MTQQRFEYSQTVDGTFRGALGADRDAGLNQALLQAGLDLSRIAPAYPAADFYRWMRLAARHRWPDLSEAEACRLIGRLCIERGLASTTLGRGVLQFIRILGPRPVFLRLGALFRIGNNYLDARANTLGPSTVEVFFGSVVGPPSYYLGLLEAGTEMLGGREARVRETGRSGESLSFRVDWSE